MLVTILHNRCVRHLAMCASSTMCACMGACACLHVSLYVCLYACFRLFISRFILYCIEHCAGLQLLTEINFQIDAQYWISIVSNLPIWNWMKFAFHFRFDKFIVFDGKLMFKIKNDLLFYLWFLFSLKKPSKFSWQSLSPELTINGKCSLFKLNVAYVKLNWMKCVSANRTTLNISSAFV